MGLKPINILAKHSSIASSNYLEHGDNFQGLMTYRFSLQPWQGATLSLDAGCSAYQDFTDEQNVETSYSPAFEAKLKQSAKIGDGTVTPRTYARYRHIGNTDQLRLAGGVGVKVGKNSSIYADGHYTTKFIDGKDNCGAWVGLDTKINNHLSLWIEPLQVNINTTTGKKSFLSNAGITYKF